MLRCFTIREPHMTINRCIHHDRCRADHARGDLLCGWHHAKAWNFCIWFRVYESQDRLEKSRARIAKEKVQESTAAKADDTIMTRNDAISETIRFDNCPQ